MKRFVHYIILIVLAAMILFASCESNTIATFKIVNNTEYDINLNYKNRTTFGDTNIVYENMYYIDSYSDTILFFIDEMVDAYDLERFNVFLNDLYPTYSANWYINDSIITLKGINDEKNWEKIVIDKPKWNQYFLWTFHIFESDINTK